MADTRFATTRGFTLIELIISMVLLSIAATTVVMLSGNIFRGLQENRDTLAKSQLMQECFETLLAKGMKNAEGKTDFAAVTEAFAQSLCSQITLPDYLAPTVSVMSGQSDAASPKTLPECPYRTSDGKSCKLITISHGELKPIHLMLVEP